MVIFGTKGTANTKTQTTMQEPVLLSKPREVQTAASLLKPHRHALQLERIKELAHVPPYYYQHFYVPAIEKVAEFVQLLPAARIIKFNKVGGLLEFSLRRTSETLAWYRRENPIRQKDPEKVSLDDAHMTWALFSAALILGLGYIPTQYWVALCQEDGSFLCRWQPLLGSMMNQGQWYRTAIEPAFDNLAHRNTLLLADMLLPKEALAWLSSNKDLFNAWLALLAGDLTDGGLFAKFIMPAEWQLLEHARPSFEADMPPSLLPVTSEWDNPNELTEENTLEKEASEALTTETAPLTQARTISSLSALRTEELSGALGAAETGQAFIEWLRQGIEGHSKRSERLQVNSPDAFVHMSKDGVHLYIGKLAQLAGMNTAQVVAGLVAMKVAFENASNGRVIIKDPTIVFNQMPGTSAYVQVGTTPPYPEIATSNTANTNSTFNAPKPLMR